MKAGYLVAYTNLVEYKVAKCVPAAVVVVVVVVLVLVVEVLELADEWFID